MAADHIAHVSDTAFWVAHYRGAEMTRPEPLFRDPLAARLAGEHGRRVAAQMPHPQMTRWVVTMRTLLIDAYIHEAIAAGVDTIINLGAGLDTRPWRLELPPTLRWVEVDYPHVIAFKQEQLRDEPPRCQLEQVPLDLADVPARRALFARLDAQAQKLVVLTEGVIVYLDVEAVAALADDLAALQHLVGWVTEYVSPASIAARRRAGLDARMQNAPFRFKPADWHGFFAEHGFVATTMHYLADEAARVDCPAPLPWQARLLMKLLYRFASPERRERFRQSAGYAWLSRAATR